MKHRWQKFRLGAPRHAYDRNMPSMATSRRTAEWMRLLDLPRSALARVHHAASLDGRDEVKHLSPHFENNTLGFLALVSYAHEHMFGADSVIKLVSRESHKTSACQPAGYPGDVPCWTAASQPAPAERGTSTVNAGQAPSRRLIHITFPPTGLSWVTQGTQPA